jgi:hypothetical protein
VAPRGDVVPKIDRRILLGGKWATVTRVFDDGSAAMVYDGEASVLIQPADVFTPAGLKRTATQIHAATERRARAERKLALRPVRQQQQRVLVRSCLPACQRGESRERRPSAPRRVARTSGSRGDPHPGEPSDPLDSWRGVLAASSRMHAKVLRRSAVWRAA